MYELICILIAELLFIVVQFAFDYTELASFLCVRYTVLLVSLLVLLISLRDVHRFVRLVLWHCCMYPSVSSIALLRLNQCNAGLNQSSAEHTRIHSTVIQ